MYKLILNSVKKLKIALISTVVVLALVSLMLPVTAVAQDEFCGTLTSEFAGFLDCETSYSSFTEFKGGLAQPDVDGYDPSLTQASDAKTFAKNVANFVLGFLGLVAVLIIIYSGFLYVTSRGEAEQMESGKKGIIYALVGIIIIFSSYALVNTILQAPGGDGTNIRQQAGLRGSGAAGRAIGSSNFNSMAKEIQLLTTETLREYQKSLALYNSLQNLTAYRPNEITKRADFVDYLNYLKTNLNNIKNSAGVDSRLAIASEVTINQVLNPGIQAIQNRIILEEIDAYFDINKEADAYNFIDDIGSGFRNFWDETFRGGTAKLSVIECSLPPAERPVNYDYKNCEDADYSRDIANLGNEIDAAFDKFVLDVILPQLKADFTQNIENKKTRLTRQKNVIASINAGGAGTTTSNIETTNLNGLFTTAETAFSSLSGPDIFPTTFSSTNPLDSTYFSDLSTTTAEGEDTSMAATQIRALLAAMQELHNAIKNSQFTVPVIVASSTTGSAPLIVTFDASQSYDPTNRSLPNGSFSWDIDGDGDEGVSSGSDTVECYPTDSANYTNSAITCVFKQPGSYLPSLIAKPADMNRTDDVNAVLKFVLPGIAYIPISVTPPVAQIDLVARANNVDTNLRKYDENGNILIDINEYSVTLETAKEGIDFDASGTDSEATAGTRKITKYEWIFNDTGAMVSGSGGDIANGESTANNSGIKVGTNANKITKKFSKRGTYNVVLAVTDNQGNVDRKVFLVKVTDLVARINTTNNLLIPANPGTEFTFDGLSSRSDTTANLAYKWNIERNVAGSTPIVLPAGLSEFSPENISLKYRFTQPGNYTVNLEVQVEGITNKTSEASLNLTINSRPPVAIIDNSFPDKINQPNLVLLDGSNSYDPDDIVGQDPEPKKYGWRIFNAAPGTDFEVVSGEITSTSNAQNAIVTTKEDNDKLEVLFKKKGTYKVEMTVEDDQGQKNVTTKDVVISSIIDVNFSENQTFASKLATNAETGRAEAKVDFAIVSRNASLAVINFGDNSGPVTERFADGQINLSHNYTNAGTFEVSIRAQNNDGSDVNTAKTLIIIGSTDTPIAVPRLKIGSATISNLSSLPPIYRRTQITLDGSSSINIDGSKTNLEYEWSVGDGRVFPSTTTRGVQTFFYTDLPPADSGGFDVTLKVTDISSRKQNTQTIKIPVTGFTPKLQALVAKLPVNKDTAPINVTAEVIGGVDQDGKITDYRFYYFPISDPSDQLGVKTVSTPSTTLTINTLGISGEQVEYGICVDLTDDDGNEVKCAALFENGSFTKVSIKNGPNDPPVASFTVDRPIVQVGETVTFTSTSTDKDGIIAEWTYDVEGDNSFTNDKTWEQGTVSHTYTKKSPASGYNVRLRVTDDKGGTAVSLPVKVVVEGSLKEEPVAAFTEVVQNLVVKFRDRSKADVDNGGQIVKWGWDFNTSLDSDGDGDPRNDVDSTEQNPTFTYSGAGVYGVALTVEDNEGNEKTITRQVTVQELRSGVTDPFAGAEAAAGIPQDNDPEDDEDESGSVVGEGSTLAVNPYRDIIRTTPTKNPDNGIITVSGDPARVTFNFSHLPTSTRRVMIDRHIYCDTNGDGVRNNDLDIDQRGSLAPITIEYKQFEMYKCNPVRENIFELPIRVQVAVEDASGKLYTDQADVIFAGSNLQARLDFSPTENVPALIYILTLFTLVMASSFIAKKKAKPTKKLKI